MGYSSRLAGLAVGLMLCGAAGAESPPPNTFSLMDALGVAYETNPQLGAARASLRATDETVASANSRWRPSISATGTYAYDEAKLSGGGGRYVTHPLETKLGFSQSLFRGGRTYAEFNKAKANVRAARADLTATEQTVLLAAATAYMDVVRDAAIVNLRLYTNLQKSFLCTLQTLANGLEARDEYTRGHSERVMTVACMGLKIVSP